MPTPEEDFVVRLDRILAASRKIHGVESESQCRVESGLSPNLQLALLACKLVARTTPKGEICFRAIPKEYKARGVTYHDLAVLESLGYLAGTGDASYFFLTPRTQPFHLPEAFDRLMPERLDKEPIHCPAAFDWWSRRYKWHSFPFECACGLEVPIRQRVTQNARSCRGCGKPVTVHAIDDQLARWEPERQRIMEMERKSGVVSTLGTIGVVAAAGLMWGVSLFLGRRR